jgi:hypothetical protein
MPTLDSKIADVSGLRVCRFCSHAIPADAVICACRIARGELPHTEWPRDVKRLLCVRTIERRMWAGCSEQSAWERMLTALYAGTVQGTGANRVVLSHSAPVVDLFPFAAGDASLWAASGYPTLYHI